MAVTRPSISRNADQTVRRFDDGLQFPERRRHRRCRRPLSITGSSVGQHDHRRFRQRHASTAVAAPTSSAPAAATTASRITAPKRRSMAAPAPIRWCCRAAGDRQSRQCRPDRRAILVDVANFQNVDASALSVGVSITGSSSANTITGGSGNDTIDGGGGADVDQRRRRQRHRHLSRHRDVDRRRHG